MVDGFSIRRDRRHKRHLPYTLRKTLAGLTVALAIVGGAGLYRNFAEADIDPISLTSISKSGVKPPRSALAISARSMPLCASGTRINCVVDGDTFWLDGTKYRIANIDTPELKGKCNAEKAAAKRARDSLAKMIDAKPIRIKISGTDPFGRRLAVVSDDNGDFGDRLVAQGLAEVWGGAFIDWCAV